MSHEGRQLLATPGVETSTIPRIHPPSSPGRQVGRRIANQVVVSRPASKPIEFSNHALERMEDRGASEAEVRVAIREGRAEAGRGGRTHYSQVFAFEGAWEGRRYKQREIRAVVAEESRALVVVTVNVFYYPAGGLP